jgi:restriction system protein
MIARGKGLTLSEFFGELDSSMLASMAVWLVRAGARGEDEAFALESDCVVIGWDELPDLSSINSKTEILELVRSIHPEMKEKAISTHTNQIWAFKDRIAVDDLAVLPLKRRAAIAIGKVSGPYEYSTERPHHRRKVEWIKKDIPRSSFDQDILYSLGAFLTVCQIQRNQAEERIKAVLEGRVTAAALPADEASDESAVPNLELYARDQLVRLIGEKFRGHELARLVDALLEAQGYQTQSSPPGPDGGVDIIAGKGALGFDAPRLLVQVKSSDAPADVRVVRELQGIMRNFGAEQCLFISWGGYRSSVSAETRSLYFQMRLWDSGDLVNALLENYELLPADIQAELPLKRIWVSVVEQS